MKHHSAAALLTLAAAGVVPVVAGGQTVVVQPADAIGQLGSEDEDRARVAQLSGRDSVTGFLLRSPSARAAMPRERAAADAGADTLLVTPLLPEVALVNNSGLPFSMNDGALWAGRGASASVTGGVRARYRWLHATLAPTIVYAQNADFGLPSDPSIAPPIPAPRSPYSNPWRVYGPSIDAPLRFGATAYRRIDFGQSALYASVGGAELGVTSENEWWGPGIRNALVLSNNAPGVPRVFARTARPLATPLGDVEARYFIGSLATSPFFEVPLARRNRGRSISAAAVTLRPSPVPNLTVGLARSVYAQVVQGSSVAAHALDVLGNPGRPNAIPLSDGTQRLGRDQIYSLFGRWVLPDAGFESYAEWGRTELPVNLRDFLVSPNHTQGYTVGLQFARPVLAGRRTARLQAELTNVAQSSTYRQRPTGSWYTSRAVLQGYTQRGQWLGAAIGPGSTAQWLAGDLFAPAWSGGAFIGRIRWDDDAYYTIPRFAGNGTCKHDVSLMGGVRGTHRSAAGDVGGSITVANRLNPFYQTTGFCYGDGPLNRGDTRNITLSLSYSPRPLRRPTRSGAGPGLGPTPRGRE